LLPGGKCWYSYIGHHIVFNLHHFVNTSTILVCLVASEHCHTLLFEYFDGNDDKLVNLVPGVVNSSDVTSCYL